MSCMSLSIATEHYKQIIVILFLRTKEGEKAEFCPHLSLLTLSIKRIRNKVILFLENKDIIIYLTFTT